MKYVNPGMRMIAVLLYCVAGLVFQAKQQEKRQVTGQGYSVINAPVTRHLQDITLPGPPPNVCTSDYVSVGRLSCVLVPVVLPVRWAAGLVVFLDSCWVFVVSAPPDWDVKPLVCASSFCCSARARAPQGPLCTALPHHGLRFWRTPCLCLA